MDIRALAGPSRRASLTKEPEVVGREGDLMDWILFRHEGNALPPKGCDGTISLLRLKTGSMSNPKLRIYICRFYLYMYIIYSIYICLIQLSPQQKNVYQWTSLRCPRRLHWALATNSWAPVATERCERKRHCSWAIWPFNQIMKSIGKDLRHININLTGMETSNTHNFVKVTYIYIYVIYVFIRFCLTHMYIILSHVLYQSMVEKMGYTYIYI